MARLLALCSLPRTNPKQRLQYVRRNGTQRRELVLGRSLYEFMHKLGLDDQGGGERGESGATQESNGAAL